jgi:hypothetical protein
MAGQVLKVHLTSRIFEYSSLREDLREVSIVGIISPQLEEEVLNALKLTGNSINTSYRERNNLTVRNGVSRVIRKTIDFSKRLDPLIMHLCLFFAWFNLVKSHDALKIEIADGRRRWKQRTPAMAANLTDHVWTLEELFRFKPPP